MKFELIVVCVITIIGSRASNLPKFIEPFSITDFECLKTETAKFFQKTADELPELGTVAIDPLAIPAFEVVFNEDIGVTFKIRNLHVSGLSNQELHAFNLDKQTRKIVFGYKADLVIEADIVVVYPKKSNERSRARAAGYFTSQPTVISNITSDLLIKKNDQGVDYYDLEPKTFTYDLVTSPQLDWGSDIKEEIENDFAWNSQSEEFKKISQQTIYEILNRTYPFVISNYRAACKVQPAAAFFKE